MDLENVKLSDISQAKKEKYYRISLISGIKNNTNKFIYKIETDSQTENTNLW